MKEREREGERERGREGGRKRGGKEGGKEEGREGGKRKESGREGERKDGWKGGTMEHKQEISMIVSNQHWIKSAPACPSRFYGENNPREDGGLSASPPLFLEQSRAVHGRLAGQPPTEGRRNWGRGRAPSLGLHVLDFPELLESPVLSLLNGEVFAEVGDP